MKYIAKILLSRFQLRSPQVLTVTILMTDEITNSDWFDNIENLDRS